VDDQRFDKLARVVAGLGSRRAVLRGLAGVATLAAWGRRGAPVSAQYGNLGPGDACYDDSQCSSSLTYGSPLVCADNGFDYDGPLNCCTGEGSYCFSDEGCCSWAYCELRRQPTVLLRVVARTVTLLRTERGRSLSDHRPVQSPRDRGHLRVRRLHR
jgi:hypothetical protein